MGTTYKEAIFCGDMAGKLTQFTSANGTTVADITTVDANGPIRIDSLSVVNNDSVAATLNFIVSDGTINFGFQVSIPIGTHVDILTASMFSPLIGHDAAGNTFLELPNGWKLQASLAAMPSSGRTVSVQARWGVYASAA